MKKVISLIVLLFIIFLGYQYLVVNSKTEHLEEYIIKNDEVVLNIKEEFIKDSYYITINYDKYVFNYKEDNNFNKQRVIVTDVLLEKIDNMYCVFPIFKNSNVSSISCNDGNNLYSYEIVKNNNGIKTFVNSIKEKGFDSHMFTTDEKNREQGNMNVYYNNLDETIIVWKYRGFDVIGSDTYYNKNTINFDRYENTLSFVVDNYYVTPIYQNNRVYEAKKFMIYDLDSNSSYDLDLGVVLSNQSYVNGIVDGKIYIFDKKNMFQLEINPNKKTARIVGNKEINCQYYNNGFETRNIYDFVNNKITFNYIDLDKLNNKYRYNSIYGSDQYYYLYENGTMYQVYKNNIDIKKTVFKMSNIKNVKVIDDVIYFVKDSYLYEYDYNYGLRKLLNYSELRYNYSNIIDIYKK